jgi:hypothetical protein
MSNVVAFPGVSTACTSSTTRELDRHSLRAAAWSNFYTAERREGTSPDIAANRADFFITKRFDGLLDDIRKIMEA